MSETLSIGEVRKNISRLAETLSGSPDTGAVTVTRRGEPVLAVMSWELYEAITETLEVMGDEELADGLRRSIRELEQGTALPWEEAVKGLGL